MNSNGKPKALTLSYALRIAQRQISEAARSLGKQKARALLSILGIIIAVTAIFAMISVGEGVRRQVMRHIEGLGMKNILVRAKKLPSEQGKRTHSGRTLGLTQSDAKRIKAGVIGASAISILRENVVSVSGIQTEIAPTVVEINADYSTAYSLTLHSGRFISQVDISEKNRVCVIGSFLTRNMRRSVNQDGYLIIGGEEYKVIGVLEKRSAKTAKGSGVSPRDYNTIIFIPFGVRPESAWMGESSSSTDSVSEITIVMKSVDHVMEGATLVKRILDVAHLGVDDYSLIIPQELFRKAWETQRTFSFALGAIAGISALIGGVGVMNIMLATVTERRKEIGVRRAIGATRRRIILLFLTETVILSTLGGVGGLLLGGIFVYSISALTGWEAAFVPWSVILSLVVSSGSGVVFGIYPAYKAASLDPVKALRG